MRARILAMVLLFGTAGASATTITVGAGCQYADLQTAIDNVGTTGTFEFHVRANYVGAPISYSNKSIWIFGGYANCNDASPIPFTGQNFDALSTIDGSRSPGRPGIQVSGASRLALHNFQIHNATNPNGNGGGISYNGSGARASLALQSVNINHNSAERGGGVFFRSTVSGTEHAMSIEDYTWIEFNTGTISGGGIRLEGNATLTANGSPASISNNTANPNDSDGAGGGLQLRDDTVANVGSPGWAGFAFIDHNHARAGGGVAVQNDSHLNLYSAVPGQHARIENNDATIGGGVYVQPAGGVPTFCMVGGGVNSNTGARGGAIYVDESGASLSADANEQTCGVGYLPGFVACPTGQACNTIDSNRSTEKSASVIDISPLFSAGSEPTRMGLRYVSLRGNSGGNLLYQYSTVTQQLESCLISGNSVQDDLVRNVGHLQIVGCSVGGNTLAAAAVTFGNFGTLELIDVIAWQPGRRSFRYAAQGQDSLQNVITADASSFNPGEFATYYNVSSADPKFENAATGDLHLQDTSPAIDAAATGTTMDLDMNPRGIDVPQSPGSPNLGLYDIGAYEVQHIDPQVPVTFPPDEDFDELHPLNSLPANWQIVPASGAAAWTLAATAADTGSLSAYAPDPPSAIDSTLTTLAFHVEHDGRLSFRHRVSLESSSGEQTRAFDAAVLEIRIGASPSFQDITAAGGRFLTGGYDHVVAVGASLLAGRPAWSGESDAFRSVVVALPASASGQDVKLRWRVATDASEGRLGYWLDTIHLDVAGEPDDVIFSDDFEHPLP